ncbi:MAG: hypothetical protein JNL70_19760 [Saprospiraceae bacterium]|nr:hypothetical protein [Saprospiraceae bacterium]
MARFHLSKRKLLIALVLTRRVAANYKPEIKLVTFLFTILIGNKFINSDITEFTVCTVALIRKYGKLLL